MHELKELKTALKFIEDKKNYYAGFRWVMEACERAHVINTALWNAGKISDDEKLAYSGRIRIAKATAVNQHKEWVMRRIKENASRHTIESIVSTIYSAIFD